MVKKLLIVISSIAVSVAGYAQNVDHLIYSSDARSLSMGGTGISSLRGNAFSIYNNTSSIPLSGSRYSAGYGWRSFDNKNFHSIAGHYSINSRHAIAAGARYVRYGAEDAQTWYDDDGNLVTDGFRPRHMDFALGYSFRINDKMAVGANVKMIRSQIANTPDSKEAQAFAGDINFTYKGSRFAAAAGVSNLGSHLEYGGATTGELPASADLGGSYYLPLGSKHLITGAMQGGYYFSPDDNNGVYIGAGLEYCFNDLISLRGGYRHLGREMDKTDLLSVGCGLQYSFARIDFTYVKVDGNLPGNMLLLNASVVF